MHGAGVVLGLAGIAFLIRCVLVVVLRQAAPRSAAFVDRWWVWLPLLAIIVGVAMWSLSVGAVVAIATAALVATDLRVDLPFRSNR